MPSRERAEGVQAETVGAMLDVLWRLLDEERQRDQSSITRAIGVAGFAGVVLSLSNTVARPALRAPLEPWADVLTLVLFISAIVLLAAAVAVALFGVLQPRASIALGSAEIASFDKPTFVFADVAMAQGRVMRGLISALLRQRARNNKKARALRWSYRLLAGGLVTIALLGLTLALIDAGVLDPVST
jgi:hypothetical protein